VGKSIGQSEKTEQSTYTQTETKRRIQMAPVETTANGLQAPLDVGHAGRAMCSVGGEHGIKQPAQCARHLPGVVPWQACLQVQRVAACQQRLQGGAQAIDIRAPIGLGAAILLRRRVARRTKQCGIPGLSGRVVARDAKVNQRDLLVRRQHNVAGLEIAEDHRRLHGVQRVQNLGKRIADAHGLWKAEMPLRLLAQASLQRLAGNVLHDQVPVVRVGQVLVEGRHTFEVFKARQHGNLAGKRLRGLDDLARAECTNFEALDRDIAVPPVVQVYGMVDNGEAAAPDLCLYVKALGQKRAHLKIARRVLPQPQA